MGVGTLRISGQPSAPLRRRRARERSSDAYRPHPPATGAAWFTPRTRDMPWTLPPGRPPPPPIPPPPPPPPPPKPPIGRLGASFLPPYRSAYSGSIIVWKLRETRVGEGVRRRDARVLGRSAGDGWGTHNATMRFTTFQKTSVMMLRRHGERLSTTEPASREERVARASGGARGGRVLASYGVGADARRRVQVDAPFLTYGMVAHASTRRPRAGSNAGVPRRASRVFGKSRKGR